MFDFIKNTFQEKTTPPQNNHEQKYFGINETHLVLLTEFMRTKSRKEITSDWQDFLNNSPQKIIDELISKGFLVNSPIAFSLDMAYKVTDLKLLLKERGLILSGKKDALIARLIEVDYQGMQSIVGHIYECSPNGRSLVEKYKGEKEIEKNKVINDVLNLILSKNIKKACQIATNYQEQKVSYISKRQQALIIQPGLELNILYVEIILNGTPKILHGISQKDLRSLRLWAALNFLFSNNKIGEELMEGFVGVPRFDSFVAKNMMTFFANNQAKLLRLNKSRANEKLLASVIGCGGCPECAAIVNKIMPINKLPELPYEKCTFGNGCRCTFTIHFDVEGRII